MKVLGIDPSLTATGIAVIDFESMTVLGWDCIRTKPDNRLKKNQDRLRRVLELRNGLKTFLTTFPGMVAIETQVPSSMGKNNSVSSFCKGLSYGVAIGLTDSMPIGIDPAEIRRRLGLSTGASKQEIWDACRIQLTVPESLTWPRAKAAKEGIQDAISVALASRVEVRQILALMPGVHS